jgi:hypothetical protein
MAKRWIASALAASAVLALGLLQASAKPPESPSVAAFRDVVKVLNHPRCMNCHTTVAWPTQGDDRHRHTFNVLRGADGGGAPGMRCTSCHQDKNQDAMNIPGAKNWHMAPVAMGWTGLTPAALCKALLDPAKNGGKSGAKVIEHLRADPLVLWAWTPGGKRTKPEVPHATFLAAAETWIKKGAECPQ